MKQDSGISIEKSMMRSDKEQLNVRTHKTDKAHVSR